MKIFYSWQSGLPNKTNRGLIQDALVAASERIGGDRDFDVTPVIDRDVQGSPGAPDIAASIFDKVMQSDVFVADVSIVHVCGADRTPNPNVLVELGFAVGTLGWERVLLVVNEAHGAVTELPFDLRQRLALTYSSAEADADRAAPRKVLSSKLEAALREIASRASRKQLPPTMRELREREIQDVTRQRVLTPARTLRAFGQALEWTLDAEAAETSCAEIMKLGRRLLRLPPNAARLLDVVNDRTTTRRWNRRVALLADVLAATEADEGQVYQLIRVLEEHAFVALDQDELEGTGLWIEIKGSNMGEWDILQDLRKFCRVRSIPASEIIVRLRFDLLDGEDPPTGPISC